MAGKGKQIQLNTTDKNKEQVVLFINQINI